MAAASTPSREAMASMEPALMLHHTKAALQAFYGGAHANREEFKAAETYVQ